ncbi:DnaJ domain-containing protein [Ilumatobacter sp.]|uniref:DnaJ domain-containing protein n=1 Tax=Ilumatobacter sp. TaxID=1967498 RepID=UPI003B52118A
MNGDPFEVLGIDADASAEEVRAARRELARRHHPDTGGDADVMRRVNVAAGEALRIRATDPAPGEGAGGARRPPPAPTTSRSTGVDGGDWVGVTSDVPSFAVEALPAQTFEALVIAAAELGELVDDDPPYVLHALLSDPTACWCRLDVLPDAGASTVGVSIAAAERRPLPPMVAVRDAWIAALNGLDWSEL